MNRSPKEAAALVAAALMRQPGSVIDVLKRAGLRSDTTSVREYIEAFHAAGCVFVKEWMRASTPIYAWQPRRNFYPDAPRPGKHLPHGEITRQAREALDVISTGTAHDVAAHLGVDVTVVAAPLGRCARRGEIHVIGWAPHRLPNGRKHTVAVYRPGPGVSVPRRAASSVFSLAQAITS